MEMRSTFGFKLLFTHLSPFCLQFPGDWLIICCWLKTHHHQSIFSISLAWWTSWHLRSLLCGGNRSSLADIVNHKRKYMLAIVSTVVTWANIHISIKLKFKSCLISLLDYPLYSHSSVLAQSVDSKVEYLNSKKFSNFCS